MVRPGRTEGPTRVEVSVAIIEITEIRDAEESYSVDFIFQAHWRDERLAWDQAEAPEVAVLRYDLTEIWHPRFVLMNEKGVDARIPHHVEVSPDGTVVQGQRYQGMMSTPLELRDFPSDSQRLPISVVAATHSPKEVELVVSYEHLLMLDRTPPAGWTLALGEPEIGVLKLSRADREMAQVTFYVDAHREASYFVWTMMLPLTLIVFMAWMIFWIDPSILPPQVGIGTAAVFSMIAYRAALRITLPKVSYLTKADVFILGCTVIVFLALAHVVAAGRFATTGREELAQRMDRIGRWVYVAAYVLILATAMLW